MIRFLNNFTKQHYTVPCQPIFISPEAVSVSHGKNCSLVVEEKVQAAAKDQEMYSVPSTIQATRGCSFNCEFCTVKKFFGCGYRIRPVAEGVLDLHRRGIMIMDSFIYPILLLPKRTYGKATLVAIETETAVCHCCKIFSRDFFSYQYLRQNQVKDGGPVKKDAGWQSQDRDIPEMSI